MPGNEDDTHLAAWLVGDLSVFRNWVNSHVPLDDVPCDVRRNRDGSSAFAAFRIDRIGPLFIVKRRTAEGKVSGGGQAWLAC